MRACVFPNMIYHSHSGLILDLEHGKQQRTWLDCKAVEKEGLTVGLRPGD